MHLQDVSACARGVKLHAAEADAICNSRRTSSISVSFDSFFFKVLSAAVLFSTYILVPAASSSIARISGGRMLSTLVMRPCMMRKCGLLTLSCTEWNRSCTRLHEPALASSDCAAACAVRMWADPGLATAVRLRDAALYGSICHQDVESDRR